MPLAGPTCTGCGADLRGAVGEEMWVVDNELYRLSMRRAELLHMVRPSSTARAQGDLRTPPPGWVQPASGSAGPVSPAIVPPFAPAPPAAVFERPAGTDVSSILLGLGVTLLVIAALVFAAVSWSHIGVVGQGALLVGLTVAAGVATDRSVRRRLTGTAEALGVLTVVLGPLVAQAVSITVDLPAIDDRTWGNLAVWSWWPIALVAIGLAAMAFGRTVGVRGARYIGVVLAQLGPALWMVIAPIPLWAAAVGLALQAGLVAVGPSFVDRERSTGSVWAWGAVVTWVAAFFVAFGASVPRDLSSVDHMGAVVAFAACALAAVTVAWRWRESEAWTHPATGAAAVASFFAAGRGFGGSVPDVAWWPVMGVVAAGGLVVADQLRGGRAAALRAVSWIVVWVAALPLFGHGFAVLVSAGSTGEEWHTRAAGTVAVDTLAGLDPAWVSALAGLLAVGAAVAAGHRGLRRRAVGWASALMALGAVLIPPLAGGSLALVTVSALVAAVGLAAVAWGSEDRLLLGAGALGILGLGLVWALGSEPLVLVVGGVAILLGVAAVVRGPEVEDPALAGFGAALASLALVGEAGLVASASGANTAWSWAVVSVTAAAAGAGLPLAGLGRQSAGAGSDGSGGSVPGGVSGRDGSVQLPPPPPPPSAVVAGAVVGAMPAPSLVPGPSAEQVVAPVAGAVLLAAHVLSLLSIEPLSVGSANAAITMGLAVGVVALASIAAQLHRAASRWWVWAVVAGVEGLALVWFRLAEADVVTLEAYTLPIAVVLGGAAWLAARARPGELAEVGSWHLEGPALALALGPTVVLALGDPGVTRQIVGLGLGAMLLGIGALWRRRAPVDLGAVAVVALGLQALLPYADQVPRWVSLGGVGAVLVLLGATFEERRRDLREARRHYSGLR